MVNSVARNSLWHSLVEDGKVIDGLSIDFTFRVLFVRSV
jgi:hypothetical protein